VNPGPFGDHGFVYGISAHPTLENSEIVSLGAAISPGPFSTSVEASFVAGRTYYLRAFATSDDGKFIVYGHRIEFTGR